MSDKDTITLPREVVQEAVKALEFAERNHDGEQSLYTTEIAALRTALAAEQPKPEPVARPWWCVCKEVDAAMKEDKT